MSKVPLKIYTKNGDKGNSRLISSDELSKSELVFDVLGGLDELNANLGLLHNVRNRYTKKQVILIQSTLFEIGAMIARLGMVQADKDFLSDKTVSLEKEIDKLNDSIPILTNFILPGGSVHAANLHVSRSVCRRVERLCVRFSDSHKGAFAHLVVYLNRLSDFLFVLARYSNYNLGVKEQIWQKHDFKV